MSARLLIAAVLFLCCAVSAQERERTPEEQAHIDKLFDDTERLIEEKRRADLLALYPAPVLVDVLCDSVFDKRLDAQLSGEQNLLCLLHERLDYLERTTILTSMIAQWFAIICVPLLIVRVVRRLRRAYVKWNERETKESEQ